MKVVVTGALGKLGSVLARQAREAGHEVVALSRAQWDITRGGPLEGDVVFNCAAYTRVDDAEREPERAFAVNRDGAARLAGDCARLVHFSTDYVFDGLSSRPYGELDDPHPLNVYGESKLAGERAVLAASPQHLVVRTSWLFGGPGRDFVQAVREGSGEMRVVTDQRGCPTFVGHLAEVALILAQCGASGLYHYADQPPTTWYGFAQAILTRGRPGARVLVPISTAELGRPARRPAYSVLDCSRTQAITGRKSRDWDAALRRECLDTKE